MRIKEVIKVLPEIMKQGEVPILVGHAGVGKTQAVRKIAEATGRKLITLVLSQMEPGDLIGMPDRKDDRTVWLKPEWFPIESNSILFLDEINRANHLTRAAVMQLLLDKRLNEHVLPDGVWVCAAMNPDTEEYDVNEVIDAAFVDRFVWIKVTNRFEDFEEYLNKKYKNSSLYLKALRNVYKASNDAFEINSPFSLPEIKPTPRAHERALKIITNMPQQLFFEYGAELLSGILGQATGVAMYEFIITNQDQVLGLEDILIYNEKAIKKSSPAEKINVVSTFISKIKDDEFFEFFNSLNEDTMKNIVKSFKLFPKEHLGKIIREGYQDADYNDKLKILQNKYNDFSDLILSLLSDGDNNIDLSKLV